MIVLPLGNLIRKDGSFDPKAMEAWMRSIRDAVAAAYPISHVAVTVSPPLANTVQALRVVNDAGATVTEVDTGVVTNSDTKIPTSKAVYNALVLKADLIAPIFSGLMTTENLTVTDLTDGYIPKHTSDALGLEDSILIQSSSRIGLGVAVPTAALHLKAGTATASTAPLKFTVAGTALVTAPEVGVLEPFSDDLYYTISTGVARKGVVLTDGYALTSGRVSFSTTNGRQTDDACLTCVPPALVLTGTTATNTASYGAEQLSTAGWTVTAGWTEAPDDVFTHAAGTTTISHSATIDDDRRYQVTWTVTGYVSGHFDITFGGIEQNGLSSSGSYGPTTTATDAFTVTPSNDFVGTVVLSLKKITAKSTPVVLLKSSEGTTRLEMRAPNGGNCTFVGEGTGGFLTTGDSNHGYGKESLNNVTTGTASNGFGSYAVYGNTTGMHNNAFGFAALYHNVTGSFNVAVGGYALEANITGSGNVAIGFEAGHWETESNKLFIDNIGRASEADGRIKALVYGIFAAATVNQYLTVNGNLNCSDGFGCNTKTAQTAYPCAAWDEPGAGAYGVDSEAHMAALVELVQDIQAALIANGIMAAV